MANLSLIQEDNRYYNWYYGYTDVTLPSVDSDDSQLTYSLSTNATSGKMYTKYFGENYDPNKMVKNIYYRVKIRPPFGVEFKVNVNRISIRNEDYKPWFATAMMIGAMMTM